jgi:hypothetical protein
VVERGFFGCEEGQSRHAHVGCYFGRIKEKMSEWLLGRSRWRNLISVKDMTHAVTLFDVRCTWFMLKDMQL